MYNEFISRSRLYGYMYMLNVYLYIIYDVMYIRERELN